MAWDQLKTAALQSPEKNVKCVKKKMLNNHRITMRVSCEDTFTYALGMRRVTANFLPKLLHFEQKMRCKKVAEEIINEVVNDLVLLQRIVTDAETWVYDCGIKTKIQSLKQKRPN